MIFFFIYFYTFCTYFYRDDLAVVSSSYFPFNAQGAQGPPPMVQERFQSVVSQLFQHVRIVL